MATGIPKKIPSSFKYKAELTYEGKLPESDILVLQPSELYTFNRTADIYANRLYYGDNFNILRHLLADKSVCGQVRLIYIDPPFSTQSAFFSRKQQHAYEDILIGTEFIEFLRRRLILMKEILAQNGSVYVHLDEKMIFHIKVIMDEIFGEENYRNCITRKKCNPKNYTSKTYGNISDYILFYTKSSDYIWNRPFESCSEELMKEYRYIEPETGRRFMKVPIHAPGERNGETGKSWKGIKPPPGKHWQYPPSKLDEMEARGEIVWSANGNPRRKVYFDQNRGISVQDIWLDFKDAHNQNIRITGYPTEKNSDMLKRIIETSSNPGDLVFDCFSGSGTTLEVSSRLGRRWIGIDNSLEAIKTTLERFNKGVKPMGDFVEKQPMENNNSHKHSLFDSSEIMFEENIDKQTSITDFVFISELEKIYEVESLL